MNKYLLSLFLFGFFLTEQIYSQGEGGGGENSGESSGEDSGSGGESSGESSGEDSGNSEGGSNNGGGGSGGGNAPDPNYVVDRYTFAANDTYAPNPYPFDMCVQISIWDSDPDGNYAMFSCSNDGAKVTKRFYSDSDCNNMTNSREYVMEVNDTDGDIRTFYCDGDDYSFTMAVDCAAQEQSGDTISVVPYVCYFDGDSSKTISNAWVCDEDDDENYFAYFATYRGVDNCDEDEATTFSTKNITEDCTSGDDSSPFTSNVAGDNYAVKILNTDWDCPSAQMDTGDDDDDDDSMGSFVTFNNGLFLLLASSIYALIQ